MGANISPRAERTAILSTKLGELDGFLLTIDCAEPGCRGERTYSVGELARFNGPAVTVAQALHRMRCQECGTKPPRAAWLSRGPTLDRRGKVRRVALVGPDARS